MILGKTGRNFAAGMSGGIAYILNLDPAACNRSLVLLEPVINPCELEKIRTMVAKHTANTGSPMGRRVLENWADFAPQFTRVIPALYKQIIEDINRAYDLVPAAKGKPELIVPGQKDRAMEVDQAWGKRPDFWNTRGWNRANGRPLKG